MRAVTVKKLFNLPEWPSPLGDIGIEIEMEGSGLNYPEGSCADTWLAKADHSMKGPGLEYYLAMPIPRAKVRDAIKELKEFWKHSGSKLKPTNCDAVHVHMNCRELTLDQTMCFILLLVMLEDVLVKWCGEEREGNLFCMRARDAENFLTVLRNCLINDKFTNLSFEGLKYATINIAPLTTFGSVEVRCMQTPKDITMVTTWVNMLCCIYDAALKMTSIRDVPDILGNYYADDLLLHIFGDLSVTLMRDDIDQLLAAGQERVREVVYSAHIYKEREKNKTLVVPKKTASRVKKLSQTAPVVGGASSGVTLESLWASVNTPNNLNIFVDDAVDDIDWDSPDVPSGAVSGQSQLLSPQLTEEVPNPGLYYAKLSGSTPGNWVKKFLVAPGQHGLFYYLFSDGVVIKTSYQMNNVGMALAWKLALQNAAPVSNTQTPQG